MRAARQKTVRYGAWLCALVILLCVAFSQSAQAETSSYPPYVRISYSYGGVSAGTIRYMSQIRSGSHYYSAYWPDHPFGGFEKPETECGTASMSMALSYLGLDRTPKYMLEARYGYTQWNGWGADHFYMSSLSDAVDRYINGGGRYSPPVIHIPGYSDLGHYVVVIGRISDTRYQILDPSELRVSAMNVNGRSANYVKNGVTIYDNIDQIHQWCLSYMNECTFYPSYLSVSMGESGTLMSEPAYSSTSPSSTGLLSLSAGKSLEVTGLYKNSIGQYWYRTSTDGVSGYVESGLCNIKSYLSNISWKGRDLPSDHLLGENFNVDWIISSDYLPMQEIKGEIREADGEKEVIFSARMSGLNALQTALGGSTVDRAMRFGDLEEGVYTLSISATVVNYYCTDTWNLKSRETTDTPILCTFTCAPPHEHYYEETVVPPTCVEEGYTLHECSCGDSYITDVEPPTGIHNYELVETVQEASCDHVGILRYACTECGDEIEEEVPLLPHSPELRGYVEVSCVQDGYSGDYVCSRCGTLLSSGDVYPALGHNWVEDAVEVEPTYYTTGRMRYICQNCGATRVKVLDRVPIPPYHQVSFDTGNVCQAPAAQSVAEGSAPETPATPVDPTGVYVFEGWYTDQEGTKAYTFTEGVETDITLYAKWVLSALQAPDAPSRLEPLVIWGGAGALSLVAGVVTLGMMAGKKRKAMRSAQTAPKVWASQSKTAARTEAAKAEAARAEAAKAEAARAEAAKAAPPVDDGLPKIAFEPIEELPPTKES